MTRTSSRRRRSLSGLFLVGVLTAGAAGLAGCGSPGAAEEPRPEPSASSSTPTAAPGPGENTATSDPSASDQPTPASTPVPPPSPGTIDETVESRPTETKEPVSIDDEATFDNDVTVEVTGIDKIEDPEAGMPNEVAGPALAVTIALTNHTADSIPLDAVVVDVLDAANVPGNRMTGDPYAPLTGSLAADASASGTYVYTVAKDQRDPVTIMVTMSAAEPVVLFRGAVR